MLKNVHLHQIIFRNIANFLKLQSTKFCRYFISINQFYLLKIRNTYLYLASSCTVPWYMFQSAGTLMYIRLLIYPLQMLSLMYSISYLLKAEDNVFWPTRRAGWANIFHPDSANHALSPPFPGLECKTGSFRADRPWFYFKLLVHFNVVGTGSIFPLKMKCI